LTILCVMIIYECVQSLGSNITVKLYVPALNHIDPDLLVIWLLAVITVVVGSLWSGLVRYHV